MQDYSKAQEELFKNPLEAVLQLLVKSIERNPPGAEDVKNYQKIKDVIFSMAGLVQSMTELANSLSKGDVEIESPTSDAIQVRTIHGTKGMEWEHVYGMGFSDQGFFYTSNPDQKRINEERKLYFTILTRSRTSFTAFSATKNTYGQDLECCRFSREAGIRIIDYTVPTLNP